jgi:hypothetical protein
VLGPFIEVGDFAQARAGEPAQTDPGRAEFLPKKQVASFFSAVRTAGFSPSPG